MSHTLLQAVVKRQLPEFVREDYPTFVAFVEAYYEFLQANNVDLKEIRDLDTTLDSFIQYFKKEIAQTLPSHIVADEKFLLQHIKDQYLSKGSEASYKLLFRILFGKNVELTYPGRQMLVASDGRWNQEISVFAQIDYGSAESIVGKLVDIQTAGRILRVLVDRKEELTGEVDRIVKIGNSYEINSVADSGATAVTVDSNTGIAVGQLVTGNGIVLGTKVVSITGNLIYISNATTTAISGKLTYSNELYEFFLDKKFFGVVNANDKIRYREQFQATVLPATTKLTVVQRGKNFRVGQVFELQSGSGTGALLKITSVYPDGGIKYAEFIKFGIGYTADFAISILASNSVTSNQSSIATTSSSLVKRNTYTSTASGNVSASPTSKSVTGSGTAFGQAGNVVVGDEMWTTDSTPLLIGVVESIESTTALTLETTPNDYRSGDDGTYTADTSISSSYTGSYTFRNIRSVGDLYTYDNGVDVDPVQSINVGQTIGDRTVGFNEQGYVNLGDYVDYEYVDAAYAGTILREFSLNYRNAQTDAAEPAIISITLGALQRYPGYFTTNNGFLSDSIFIQDSKYYQAFSYVVRIDERLSSYKSAVKTMLHPAGMALFGEFNITNNYDLSLQLESLVKSLGIGLDDVEVILDSGHTLVVSKGLSHAIDTPLDNNIAFSISKPLSTSLDEPEDSWVHSTSKALGSALLNDGETLDTNIASPEDSWVHSTSKALGSQYMNNGVTLESTTVSPTESISGFDIEKSLGSAHYLLGGITTETTSVSMTDVNATSLNISKALTTDDETIYTEAGKVWMNSYQGQDYYSEEYSVGLEETFT